MYLFNGEPVFPILGVICYSLLGDWRSVFGHTGSTFTLKEGGSANVSLNLWEIGELLLFDGGAGEARESGEGELQGKKV